ncbi:hypothetical protein [Crateriforma spongiae]|uniref:hypothetical protein n=1 Tax=Crateriforma spongiae TaxID=2724528 RepID=UPI0014457699|nr:hypothetical protein [Crateriforma spongiae]
MSKLAFRSAGNHGIHTERGLRPNLKWTTLLSPPGDAGRSSAIDDAIHPQSFCVSRMLIEKDPDLQRLQDALLRFIRNDENSGISDFNELFNKINGDVIRRSPKRNDVAYLVWRDRLVLTAAYYYGIENGFGPRDLSTIIGRLDDIGFRTPGDWISFRGELLAALRAEGRDHEADAVKADFCARYDDVRMQLEDAIQRFRSE